VLSKKQHNMKKIQLLALVWVLGSVAVSHAQTYYLSLFNTQQVYTLRPTAFGKASDLSKKSLQGDLALLIDSSYTKRDLACQGITRDYEGKIVIINIGECDYGKKLKKAEKAGVTAIIFLKDAATAIKTKNGKFLEADLDCKGAKVPCFTLEPDSLLSKQGIDQNEVVRTNAPSRAFIYAVANKDQGRVQADIEPTPQNDFTPTVANFDGIITLSPNPTEGATQLHVVFSDPTDSEVQVFNTMGQLVQRQAIPQALDEWITLDLSNLPIGHYQVRVVNEKGSWGKGIVKNLP
jgi:hypothetical protein